MVQGRTVKKDGERRDEVVQGRPVKKDDEDSEGKGDMKRSF